MLQSFKEIKAIKVKGFELDNEVETEIFDELEKLKHSLFSRLEIYLKSHIQKRGITLIQNNYSGFETEYELLEHFEI